MDAISLPKLTRLRIKGFRSIEDADLTFGDLDVMIGANGAGKSNLIAFLRMMSFMLSSESGLAVFVARSGGASALLHDGPKQTTEIEAHISIGTSQGLNEYRFRLGYASDDTFIFMEERFRFSGAGTGGANRWVDLGAAHRHPQLIKSPSDPLKNTHRTVLALLRGLSVFQFHDTSDEAPIKRKARLEDSRYLRGDAQNVAPFLLRMRDDEPLYYARIVDTLRLIAPFFEDFVLEPDFGSVLLRWREKGTDLVVGPSQMSDGTLRVVALLALLLQSPDTLPPMVVLDEPELGLHPYAVRVVAGALKSLAVTHQCLVATQSPQMLDECGAESILVVERTERGSRFSRLPPLTYEKWLSEYRLSDLWDMNLLGGRPEPMAAE